MTEDILEKIFFNFKLLQQLKVENLSKWHIKLHFLPQRDSVFLLERNFFFIFYREIIADYCKYYTEHLIYYVRKIQNWSF